MATTNILIIKYNNYYNRQIKTKYYTSSDYESQSPSYKQVFEYVNFYKGDGVNAELILNITNGTDPSISIGYDYLVESHSETGEVLTRWFIIESKQERAGQFRLTLRRDLITDNYDDILDANMYVEKATISNTDDIAIYNQEDISFNQIKQSETLLKDETDSAWIVGYYTQTADITIPITIPSAKADYTVSDISILEQYEENDYVVVNSLNIKQYISAYYSSNWRGNILLSTIDDPKLNSSGTFYAATKSIGQYDQVGLYTFTSFINYFNEHKNNIISKWYEVYTGYHSTNGLQKYHNKYVYDSTHNKYYFIQMTTGSTQTSTINHELGTTFSDYMNNLYTSISSYSYQSSKAKNIITSVNNTNYRLTITEVSYSAENLSLTIDNVSRHLNDVQYKMFCIPYNGASFYLNGQPYYNWINDPQKSLKIASDIAKQLGSNLYDLQLLPYFPLRNWIGENGIINLGTRQTEWNHILDDATPTANVKGIVCYGLTSSFTLDINNSITMPSDVVESKVANQCDMYRLCSPNYAAQFDFNIVKTGSITKFNVDCTYKPYNPYIHINPNWSRLYGRDFNGSRGLIVQGDFSVPILNSQWINYQINNKNYLNAFNRQTDSIELQNKYTKIQEIANVGTGVLSGAVSGGVIGGIGGAIAGGLASGAAGIYDLSVNEKLRNDALDLRQDQFNYSLDNIKARPDTLSKVSSFDANNKIFPILEYYSCTEQEKNILKDKMTYNGMTIMRIGTLADFISSSEQYFKAKLIRSNITDDYHTVNAIADELNQGIYIKEL